MRRSGTVGEVDLELFTVRATLACLETMLLRVAVDVVELPGF